MSRAFRGLTVLLLAGATIWAAAGPAAAGVTRSTLGLASVFLTNPDPAGPEILVPFDVFAPEGVDAFGRGEIFVLGFECVTEDAVPATVDGLASASAQGELAYVCNSPTDSVTGTATVDLAWIADGRTRRVTTAGPFSPCVTHLQIRHATVTGSVHILIPDLGVDVTATSPGDDDDSVRQERSLCHPSRP